MFHFSDSLCVDQKPQRATTEIWTSNDVLLYFLTMDNGSLNTNGTGTQREARMCRDGGWRESSHYHRMGCITSVEKKILFSVAKLLLSFVENIWGPCKPMLRLEKIRVDEQFSPRKKYYHQLKRNKCIFLCFSNPFHNRKLIILPLSFLHPVLDLFLGSVKQVAFLCIIQLCWVKCAL